jgi:methyltransferase (TIGR00027 family)
VQAEEPSRTAIAAAGHRAVHQIVEGGKVFADPLAVRILGVSDEKIAELVRRANETAAMRFFIASRSAIAEAVLARAFEQRGVRQLVIVGAGLDTLAYRNPFGPSLRIFEVDHPASQQWKRLRLEECGVAVPPWLHFVPCDFERARLTEALRKAGWRENESSFFTWLGVVPYLSRDAICSTLRQIGANSSELVFDYGEPAEVLSEDARRAQARRAATVAAMGEPFLSYFEPPEMASILKTAGFGVMEDLGPHRLLERYLRDHAPGRLRAGAAWRRRPDRGGHIVVARTCD